MPPCKMILISPVKCVFVDLTRKDVSAMFVYELSLSLFTFHSAIFINPQNKKSTYKMGTKIEAATEQKISST